MDGQHRSGLGKSRYRRINRPQEKRQKGRVPVVAMKYIRHEPQALTALDRGAREQQEASMFIRIKGVEIRTTEQLGAIDEVHRDPGTGKTRRPYRERINRRVDGNPYTLQAGYRPQFRAGTP